MATDSLEDTFISFKETGKYYAKYIDDEFKNHMANEFGLDLTDKDLEPLAAEVESILIAELVTAFREGYHKASASFEESLEKHKADLTEAFLKEVHDTKERHQEMIQEKEDPLQQRLLDLLG